MHAYLVYSILFINLDTFYRLAFFVEDLPVGWIDQSSESDECVRLCKLKNLPLESNQPVVVKLCLVVHTDGSWSVLKTPLRDLASSHTLRQGGLYK